MWILNNFWHFHIVANFSKPVRSNLSSSAALMKKNLSQIDREIIQRHKQAILKNKDTYEDPVTKYSVFTKTYHLNRGECCGSACRHQGENVSEYIPVLVLFGSQTGTAEEVAERIAMQSRGTAFSSRCMALDDCPIESLVYEKTIIFVCSTTGQGEPPDNMKKFWRFIMRKNLPSTSLSDVQFAVLGLGDSSYARYNFIGKKLYKRLQSLGGHPFTELGLADDQHDWGPDAVVDSWTTEMWRNLLTQYPKSTKLLSPLDNSLPPPRVAVASSKTASQVTYHKTEKRGGGYNRKHPYHACLIENRRVTSADHFQETRHIKFDISSVQSELKYLPGDVVMIMPSNLEEDVEEFLNLLPFPPDTPLYIDALNDDDSFIASLPQPVTMRHLATTYLDFMSVPRRSFFQTLYHFATDENERDKLKEFGSPEGTEERYSYANRSRRTILEVLQDFHLTSKNIPLERIFDVFPLIRARAFSIASSALQHCGEIHVLVAAVRYKTRLFRPRQGLCSTWLSRLQPGNTVPMWVKKGGIRFPEGRPCILVGPGTGIAPFRSAAHERCSNQLNETIVIFGCRGKEHDFYFKEEWKSLPVTFYAAFSRDQEEKIYVQDKILENGKELWTWINEKDACVFVAGNSKNMPDGVKNAFLDIFCNHGNMTSDDAYSYYETMQRSKRYQQETWS